MQACGHGRTAEAALPAEIWSAPWPSPSSPARIMLSPTTIRRRPATRFLRFAETIYRVALADGIMDRVTYQDPPEDAS